MSRSHLETQELGRRVAESLSPGCLVLLTGPIGAGKSVLAHGIGQGLGIRHWRGSPTFTIVNEYDTHPPLYHLDLYRLAGAEIEELGLEEYARGDAVLVVEWADRALPYLMTLMDGDILEVTFVLGDGDERVIDLQWGREREKDAHGQINES